MKSPDTSLPARQELARRNYGDWLEYAHGPVWKRTRMSAYIAGRVQSFLEEDTERSYDILVIETPPQHGKSMTVTESLPAWYLGRHPDRRVILASYNSEFAERFTRRNREKLIEHGPALFGVTVGGINRAQEFEIAGHRGRMISRGIMSGITGNPADLVIVDDPVKNRLEADSETYRNRVWEEWQNSIKTRLAAGSKVIVIMTPWHEDDLAARILRTEKSAVLLRLPVAAGPGDPLGRQPGEALCPELGKDDRWLEDFRRGYLDDPCGGRRAWTALYMCSPRVEDGNLIRRSWWRFFDPSDTPRQSVQLISVDAAFKGGAGSDYVSVQVWSKAGTDYRLEYCLNRRLDFPGTVEAIRTVRRLFPAASTVLIEDKANGPAVISVLQREMFCIPVKPLGGKVARVNAVAPAIESGHVLLPLPEKAPWVEDFIDQFTAFPSGAHDDMVDAASQALNRLLFAPGSLAAPEPDEEEKKAALEERRFTDSDTLFSPYGL